MTFLGIGMRNLKTALSVFIILIICGIFSVITGIHSTGFYGAISAVICMQTSSKMTVRMGADRVGGSFIGAFVAACFYAIFGNPANMFLHTFLITIALIIAIQIVNLSNLKFGGSVAAIMVLSTFLVVPAEAVYITIVIRCLETIVGVVVASLVNNYVAPYDPEEANNA